MVAPSTAKYYNFKPNAFQRFGASRAGGKRKHRGADFSHSTKPGTLVPALIGGTVTGFLSPSSAHGFGYQTQTKGSHAGRPYKITYSHGTKKYPLKVGQKIAQGDWVSTEGTTGAATGPCCHVEVYDVAAGGFIDPMILVKAVLGGVPAGTPNKTNGKVTVSRPVKDIQRLVGATVDGVYGPATTQKVKAWQRRNGLTADGIWGPKSDAKGFPKATTKPKAHPPTVRRGHRGDTVRKLQRILVSRNHPMKVDGIFGPRTEEVVRAVQKRHGLVVDGICGPKTWTVLGQ